jgi:CDP-diglyceride synthetase
VALTSLQRRVLTASVLAPVAILAVLALPTWGFALALGPILLGGAWEWSALGGLTRPAVRLGYVALIGAALSLLWFLPKAGGGAPTPAGQPLVVAGRGLALSTEADRIGRGGPLRDACWRGCSH